MVLMPCSKCCKTWRCFTDGTDYVCVGPDETPPAGWTTDGIGHATELDCIANCGVIQCYRNTAEQRQYRCFSSLELDPDQKIWQPYSTVIYNDKDSCDINCGPRGLCCLPDGTSITTNSFDCDYKGGIFFENYFPPNTGFPPPVCAGVNCENITCIEDGQPQKCVTYTVKIKATNLTPDDKSGGVLSWERGTPPQNPYPLNQIIDPSPYGPKIDSIWPNVDLNWESEVTVGPDEEGELVASFNIPELMSLTSHWNAQNPTNPISPSPSAPDYVGDFGCEVESVIPFRVIGCDTSCIQIVFGRSEPAFCALPSDAGKPIRVYTDPDCIIPGCPEETQYIPGAFVEIGKSYLTNNDNAECISNCLQNDSGQIITCQPCSGEYTFTYSEDMEYWFGPTDSTGLVRPAFSWWPTAEDPTAQEYELGTAYNVKHKQRWEVTLSLNEVDCEEQRIAKRQIEKGQIMGLRNKVIGGPGTELANMLKAWGIHPKKSGGCKCKDMEVKMNRLGIACKEPKNLKMIVDHLQAEAKKRSLPFVRKVGEMLVLRAVKKFEQNS